MAVVDSSPVFTSAAPAKLEPSEKSLQYEEGVIQNRYLLKQWWSNLIALSDAPFVERQGIYENALTYLPGSYKLWHAYLRERLETVRNLPITHSRYESLDKSFKQALSTMHKYPRIWILYLDFLIERKFVTATRRTFDRALCALPVTQHEQIWSRYLKFVNQNGIPIETSLRVYRRYLRFDPSHVENFIEFLKHSERWQEAAERLARLLNDDQFFSIKGKTKHQLWLELCDLLTQHSAEVSGLNVDAIIRGGIRKVRDEVGRLWASLAEYYVRRGMFEKARDIFEEGMASVVTVRDFSVIFDAYSQFEETAISTILEDTSENEDVEGEANRDEEEDPFNVDKLIEDCKTFWLGDDVTLKDVDLRLERLENLLKRRPKLANSVQLRQNPHNVEQWHRRVKLFNGKPWKQIQIIKHAINTIDPMKAVGKLHTLWVALAKHYESLGKTDDARLTFDKAVQVNYKAMDDLASVWCEWVEMEVRHKNFKKALDLMSRAIAKPSVEVKRRVAADGNEPVQMKIHKSLRLWSLYAYLEKSLGNLESTLSVYDSILDLRIATPEIIINYAALLEDHKRFEDAFRVYERGVNIFRYPHAKDIWVTYLTKFVERYRGSKLHRARDLFECAVKVAPAEVVKPLYMQYAKFEEDFGLAKRAMMVYDQAAKAVPAAEKLSIYEIYIARAAEIFGVPRTREIYEQAIESGLPDKDAKIMCLKYAELEKSLGEIDRARALYEHSSQFADPRSFHDFWLKWQEFEVQHGNEDKFREMLRVKRSVSARYSQMHLIDPEHLIAQKDVPGAVFGGLVRKREETDVEEVLVGALARLKRSRGDW
ncbi:OLC1v1021756C1 [Oldenlandia corymbosa var. corymbosa]|uniref:Pre-mRNA-splicing factor SYF1 n=1 Tax=Oldenlandia corymbosa var. corymbosa TaxID=529605 RepID=A0AAV1BWZ2_OLDCO|nr:OLC1v1021756C1 [Oldenlandia corymbosa var. corymbosa]